jgi:DNA-binding beta-propeller fold protein YncE
VDPATGIITTFAGNGVAAFAGDGGMPTAASLQRPWGITFDGDGNLYIADTLNNRIRMVTP